MKKLKKKIYLDNNATTQLDPEVIEAMLPYLGQTPHNPSSTHAYGREAKSLLLNMREKIAHALGISCDEIIFTSGGTEGLNLLIKGTWKEGEILTTDLEHPAVMETLHSLPAKIHTLSPGLAGVPSPEAISDAITPQTKLIVLSAVYSETGAKLDLEKVSQLANEQGIPLIIDAVALLGKEPFIMPKEMCAMAFSAHKFHGPKGSGFITVPKGFPLSTQMHGGGQEKNLRSGTENLAAIVGLAKAIELINHDNDIRGLRDHFETRLQKEIPNLIIHSRDQRVANVSNLAFPGMDGETLLMQLDLNGVMASHGSACSAGALEPSRVLLNMGIPRDEVRSSLRFSLSRFTTLEEINIAADTLIAIYIDLMRMIWPPIMDDSSKLSSIDPNRIDSP